MRDEKVEVHDSKREHVMGKDATKERDESCGVLREAEVREQERLVPAVFGREDPRESGE